MGLRIRDNSDALLDRLDRVATALENREFGTSSSTNVDVEKTYNIETGDTDAEAVYYSTGPNPILLDESSFGDAVTFGFQARTINIRTTDDLMVAFKKPSGEGAHIFVGGHGAFGTDTPPRSFTIGGDAGIDTASLWLKKAPSASSDPQIMVIAYR